MPYVGEFNNFAKSFPDAVVMREKLSGELIAGHAYRPKLSVIENAEVARVCYNEEWSKRMVLSQMGFTK